MTSFEANNGKCTCMFCGKETKSYVNYGPSFGVTVLNGSGRTYVEFDACEECLEKVLRTIESEMTK